MEAKQFDLSGIGLSERQIAEHLKLYNGYIKKSDEIREKFSKINWEDANTTQSDVRSLILGETFANNGVRLHEAYFENLENEKSETEGKIKKLLLEKFKNIEEFKKRLIAFSLSSRGWVILAWDFDGNRLRLFGTDQHDIAVWNCIPLLVLDMYEHAYFIDFGTDKKKYVEWFFNNINWKVVDKRAERRLNSIN